MVKQISSMRIVFMGLVLLLAHSAYAQRGQWKEHHQQIEARRIAYITSEVALTPAEAQVFWPLYNEYHQKRNEMMLRHRGQRKQSEELDKFSEKELLQLADADIRNMEEMAQLRREYHEKFKAVLPIRKVVDLYEAERNFNRQLYQESRRQQRGGRGRN